MSRISLTKKEQNNPSEHLNKLLDFLKNQYQFSYILLGFKNVLKNINTQLCSETITRSYLMNAIIAVIPEDEVDIFYADSKLTYICSCGTTHIFEIDPEWDAVTEHISKCNSCNRLIQEHKILEYCNNNKKAKLLSVK